MKERGQIITLHCCNKRLLEEHVRLLANTLRNKTLLTQTTNGKISPFVSNMTEKDLEDVNHGIWILVEDYSTINPEQAIDFNADLTILLDGLVCGRDSDRLILLESAHNKKWEIVSLDEQTEVIQRHIMDHIDQMFD